MANEIETTDSVDLNDKFKEENYTIPQETQGKLTTGCVLDYENGIMEKVAIDILGLFKETHSFGIRLDTLPALGPLFPATGKPNYALSIVHFRAILER
ncbi:hypothetical protein Glove_217g125 [Diversispora epigaea]|uniref:Uncharacterized protein n=1 Tax=Diversispora epigaea TaxID=1348612 RepID=A0A397ILP7_9GLOM|nr:hypothetical protein Glove_217g125 [Diversispora epigaea]